MLVGPWRRRLLGERSRGECVTETAHDSVRPERASDAPPSSRSGRTCSEPGCSRLAWHERSAGWRCAYHLAELTAEQRRRQHEADRSRRARVVGAQTAELTRGRPTGDPLIDGDAELSELLDAERLRPRTRGDCARVPRPCPFVSCRHSLWGEITIAGNLKRYRPDVAPWEMPPRESCALDVADEGQHTLEDAARALNVTRERARQIEAVAFTRVALSRLEDWRP